MFNNNNCNLSIMCCYVKVDGHMDYMSSIMTYAMCITDKLLNTQITQVSRVVLLLLD